MQLSQLIVTRPAITIDGVRHPCGTLVSDIFPGKAADDPSVKPTLEDWKRAGHIAPVDPHAHVSIEIADDATGAIVSVRANKHARKLAEKHGIDLRHIEPTGGSDHAPQITKRDVQQYLKAQSAADDGAGADPDNAAGGESSGGGQHQSPPPGRAAEC